MGKISGPLLDRIDIHVEVPAVKYNELSSKKAGESSVAIRSRVVEAREAQRKRFDGRRGLFCNADMESKEIKEFCQIVGRIAEKKTDGEELSTAGSVFLIVLILIYILAHTLGVGQSLLGLGQPLKAQPFSAFKIILIYGV